MNGKKTYSSFASVVSDKLLRVPCFQPCWGKVLFLTSILIGHRNVSFFNGYVKE